MGFGWRWGRNCEHELSLVKDEARRHGFQTIENGSVGCSGFWVDFGGGFGPVGCGVTCGGLRGGFGWLASGGSFLVDCTVVQMKLSLMEDLKQRKIVTTVGKHRWGAGQSSSDAFVRGFEESD
uniref:Uncharacterized protein n=1 Tax=Fagus sylvatica TaxID=28930 RepID=A0A2N9GWR8_FAGSY